MPQRVRMVFIPEHSEGEEDMELAGEELYCFSRTVWSSFLIPVK